MFGIWDDVRAELEGLRIQLQRMNGVPRSDQLLRPREARKQVKFVSPDRRLAIVHEYSPSEQPPRAIMMGNEIWPATCYREQRTRAAGDWYEWTWC